MKANTIYGYIRVSTANQREDRQRLAMENFGIARSLIFADKESGKDFDRPAYRRLMKRLAAGDTIVIKSIDRLGRNYAEIIDQWRKITKEKRAAIVVLDMPLLDTRQKRGDDLTGTLIADIVLELFSYVAQIEREMNISRTREGVAAAKLRGVKFGREPMERPPEFEILREKWAAGEISARQAAKILGVTHPTFLKWAKK